MTTLSCGGDGGWHLLCGGGVRNFFCWGGKKKFFRISPNQVVLWTFTGILRKQFLWGVTTFFLLGGGGDNFFDFFTMSKCIDFDVYGTCQHHSYIFTYAHEYTYTYNVHNTYIDMHCYSLCRNVSILLFTVPVGAPFTCSHTPTHIHIHTYTYIYIHAHTCSYTAPHNVSISQIDTFPLWLFPIVVPESASSLTTIGCMFWKSTMRVWWLNASLSMYKEYVELASERALDQRLPALAEESVAACSTLFVENAGREVE